MTHHRTAIGEARRVSRREANRTPLKHPKEDYAAAFGRVVEVGLSSSKSRAINWRDADKVNMTADQLADLLNRAYRAGQYVAFNFMFDGVHEVCPNKKDL